MRCLVGPGVKLPETGGHDPGGNVLDRRDAMAVPYTHGIWQVKPGHAEEFVAAWTEFADWTVQHADGTGWGKLLRDVNDEHRFVSFGPWESFAAIESWRALDGWNEWIRRIRELLVSFEPATLELVVERG
jgi:quinol monooxygenase YgiN